jgi:hypothetical protein
MGGDPKTFEQNKALKLLKPFQEHKNAIRY